MGIGSSLRNFATGAANAARENILGRGTTATRIDDAIKTDPPPMAYYLSGDGKIEAVKTGIGTYPGANNYAYSLTSPYSGIPIVSNPTSFAYASIVNTWANRCIDVRAMTINRLKVTVVSRKTGKPIPDHPFMIALARANKAGQKIFELHERSRMIWGETFLWPIINDYGYHSDIRWLNNLGMEVLTVAGEILSYSYAPINGGQVHQFDGNELAFLYTFNPFNDLRGLSPFDTILLEVGVDQDMARYVKSWYTNDARPGLMLLPKVDLSIPDAQKFMDFWKTNFQGSANANKPVLMPSVIQDVKDVQQAPQIADIELRLSVRTEICSRFGVPLAIAGAWDDSNYDSVDTQRKAFYEDTIIPEVEEIDDDFTNQVLPFFDEWGDARIEHQFTTIKALMEDEDKKTGALNGRLQAGAITLNEYRQQLDMPPLPNGNVFYMPSGVTVTPMADIGKPPEPPPMQPGLPSQPPAVPEPSTPSDPAQDVTSEPPPPNPQLVPGKSVQDSATDELNAWVKRYRNVGALKSVKFDTYLIRDEMAVGVRLALESGFSDAITRAFDALRKALAVKAIQATRLDFENEFEALLDRARTENTDRRAFGATLRYFLNKFGKQAYLDGLQDGGVDTTELDSEDRDEIAVMLGNQSQYVTEFGSVLFKGDGITDYEAADKPALWFNKSITPMYQAGLLSADKNGLYEWVYGDTEHCETCRSLNGQRHRLKDYARRDLMPQSGALACGGWNCKCKLVKASGKARGEWPSVTH